MERCAVLFVPVDPSTVLNCLVYILSVGQTLKRLRTLQIVSISHTMASGTNRISTPSVRQ